MDREPEELQFLGVYGIYREAYKITISCKKLFSQIFLTLIFPLAFIFLGHLQVSKILFSEIRQGDDELDHIRTGTPTYKKIQSQISSELTLFWLFKAAYLLFVLILSLLSTSAIVYTIACLYTAKPVSFKKVISVVPKVWKRLIITFLWNFIIMLVYNFAAFAIIIFCVTILIYMGKDFMFILAVLIILYLVGFVYISVIWHLASVISVLEDIYGIQAMIKSKALIKGKMLVASAIFLKLQFSFVGIEIAFDKLVLGSHGGMLLNKVSYGVVFLSLLAMLIHYALVIQTVVYFVCKSYHHESIDKSCLADHLEVYLGEYVPLKSKDLQLEQFNNYA